MDQFCQRADPNCDKQLGSIFCLASFLSQSCRLNASQKIYRVTLSCLYLSLVLIFNAVAALASDNYTFHSQIAIIIEHSSYLLCNLIY